MQILKWKIDPSAEKEAEEHYRTRFALSLKDKDFLEIIKAITFDNVAPNIEISDMSALIKYVNNKFLNKKIKGIGLEVGSGCGAFCSVLAKENSVEKIYGVEFVANIVQILMPKVARGILDDKEDKVIGCVGDFNNIELPDNSVDFVFDFFSIHHSEDLNKTMSETYRVLKPGGFVFCFDKARPNSHTKDDLEEMIDQEYGDSFKKEFGVPVSQKLTRRMNGEREYRLKDWLKFFNESGFRKTEYFYLKKTLHSNIIMRTIKTLISLLPVKLQILVTKFLPSAENNSKFTFEPQNIIYTNKINRFPKEISLLIAHK